MTNVMPSQSGMADVSSCTLIDIFSELDPLTINCTICPMNCLLYDLYSQLSISQNLGLPKLLISQSKFAGPRIYFEISIFMIKGLK